jgi:hypothetical protein
MTDEMNPTAAPTDAPATDAPATDMPTEAPAAPEAPASTEETPQQ